MNAGECSFQWAVEVFRGTDTVIIPRWVLNKWYSFDSRVDFVKYILATRTPDVSVFLQAHYFRAQAQDVQAQAQERDAEREAPLSKGHQNPNTVAERILQVIEKYVSQGVIE
jgi:hypothetical protein